MKAFITSLLLLCVAFHLNGSEHLVARTVWFLRSQRADIRCLVTVDQHSCLLFFFVLIPAFFYILLFFLHFCPLCLAYLCVNLCRRIYAGWGFTSFFLAWPVKSLDSNPSIIQATASSFSILSCSLSINHRIIRPCSLSSDSFVR